MTLMTARARTCGTCSQTFRSQWPIRECSACAERQRATAAAAERTQRLTASWRRMTVAMPQWPWARFGNADWLRRVDERAVAAARAWQPEERGVFLLGPTGRGKTSALCARLAELFGVAQRQAADCDIVPLPRIEWTTEAVLGRARRQHPLGQGEAPAIARAMSARGLIVDETGFVRAPELSEVLDARYAAGLPTSITTGLTAREWAQAYGAAVYRRVLELADVVDLHGDSK